MCREDEDARPALAVVVQEELELVLGSGWWSGLCVLFGRHHGARSTVRPATDIALGPSRSNWDWAERIHQTHHPLFELGLFFWRTQDAGQ